MRDVEEMSVQETADLLGIPPATVRTRLFRARALLRQALARDVDSATVDVFAFAGARCDRIVAGVLARLPRRSKDGIRATKGTRHDVRPATNGAIWPRWVSATRVTAGNTSSHASNLQ